MTTSPDSGRHLRRERPHGGHCWSGEHATWLVQTEYRVDSMEEALSTGWSAR